MIDTHVLSNHWDACAKKKKATDAEFQQWRLHDHVTKSEKNHNRSAGAMEPVGTQVIFHRSQDLYDMLAIG